VGVSLQKRKGQYTTLVYKMARFVAGVLFQDKIIKNV
jgi:hypothetical protein